MKRLTLHSFYTYYLDCKELVMENDYWNGFNLETFNDNYGLLLTPEHGYMGEESAVAYRVFNIVDESKFSLFMLKYPQLIISIE